MQDRRDQVQAHGFVVGRLVSALLRAEPDALMTPLRRFSVGTVCGILIGALALVGFGIYGVFVPGGNQAWRRPGALVVEKETGARYVVVGGQLRPVLNYTSARLLLNGEPTVVRVSRNSLRGMPRGLAVGIPYAPDHLPDIKRLDGTRWAVCSSQRRDASNVERPFVTLWVGSRPAGRSLPAGAALLVRTPDDTLYMAWRDRRLRVPSTAVLGALGYDAVTPRAVGWPWVNALLAGPDLDAPDVPGRGTPGPVVEGRPTVVGQLFKVSDSVTGTGAGEQYQVVHSDGLAPLTLTGAALLLADPDTRKAYPGTQVAALPLTPAGLAAAPRSRTVSVNPRLPATPPEPAEVGAGEAPCVRLTMGAAGPAVAVGVGSAETAGGTTPSTGVADQRLADRVVVEPGAGLLLRDQPAPGIAGGALSLLVDTGVRYPLPSGDVVDKLGYRAVTPTPVPAALLTLIPVGPALDPEAARATVPAVPPSPAAPGSASPSASERRRRTRTHRRPGSRRRAGHIPDSKRGE